MHSVWHSIYNHFMLFNIGFILARRIKKKLTNLVFEPRVSMYMRKYFKGIFPHFFTIILFKLYVILIKHNVKNINCIFNLTKLFSCKHKLVIKKNL